MSSTDVLHHEVPAESGFGCAQAIRSGDLTHGSGQLSLDEPGAFRHPGDLAARLRLTRATIDRVLDH